MKKRFYAALATYLVLGILAGITLEGKIRLATLVFLAGFKVGLLYRNEKLFRFSRIEAPVAGRNFQNGTSCPPRVDKLSTWASDWSCPYGTM
jgi:hypothetical protein